MNRPISCDADAHISFDDAIALLDGDPEGVLQAATDVSMDHADTIVANLHAGIHGHDVAREVTLELGQLDPVDTSRIQASVRWEAAHGHVWFPTVDAGLDVAAVSIRPPRVRITLVGAYRPPLGPLGVIMDAGAAHRIAEATTQAFVVDVARRLEQLIGDIDQRHRPPRRRPRQDPVSRPRRPVTSLGEATGRRLLVT